MSSCGGSWANFVRGRLGARRPANWSISVRRLLAPCANEVSTALIDAGRFDSVVTDSGESAVRASYPYTPKQIVNDLMGWFGFGESYRRFALRVNLSRTVVHELSKDDAPLAAVRQTKLKEVHRRQALGQMLMAFGCTFQDYRDIRENKLQLSEDCLSLDKTRLIRSLDRQLYTELTLCRVFNRKSAPSAVAAVTSQVAAAGLLPANANNFQPDETIVGGVYEAGQPMSPVNLPPLKSQKISISIAVDSVGAVAAALAVRSNFERYRLQVDVLLHGENGAEQVQLARKGRARADFAVYGIPSFSLNLDSPRVNCHRLVTPLHEIQTQVLTRDPKHLACVILPAGGFAQMFMKAKKSTDWGKRCQVEEGRFSALSLAAELSSKQGVLAFEPVASTLCQTARLRPALLGDLNYNVHVGLFLNNEFLARGDYADRQATARRFAYAFCSEYLAYQFDHEAALKILVKDDQFRRRYALMAGIPPL